MWLFIQACSKVDGDKQTLKAFFETSFESIALTLTLNEIENRDINPLFRLTWDEAILQCPGPIDFSIIQKK